MSTTHLDPSKLHKLQELQQAGINPYPYSYPQTHHAQEINEKYAKLNSGDHTKDKVQVAGRIVLKRIMGKAAFFHLQDQSGKVQLYFREDDLGEIYQTLVKTVDLGDFIGAEGIIFKTKIITPCPVPMNWPVIPLLRKRLITVPMSNNIRKPSKSWMKPSRN